MNRFTLWAAVLGMSASACQAPAGDEGMPATGAERELSEDANGAMVVSAATLAALSDADTTTLRALLHPSARLVALSEDPTVEPRVSDVEQFLASVGSPGTDFLERMWEPTVLVDGRLATVWTPYDFYRGGEFSHCGIDAFHLVRGADDDWRVLSITYTVHPEGCAESPLGPPR